MRNRFDSIRNRVVRIATASVLVIGLIPILASTPVNASSIQVVTSSPCATSGTHAYTSKTTMTFIQQSWLGECSSGGYWYVRPTCGVQAGDNGSYDFSECYVFAWNGSTYVGRAGFSLGTHYGVPGTMYNWTSSSLLKLSGYLVSSETCADVGIDISISGTGGSYTMISLGCAQSRSVSLGS
jgi:hypothetical protein